MSIMLALERKDVLGKSGSSIELARVLVRQGPLVDRSSGMTTAFSDSGGDPLDVVPGWSGSVCHGDVSVQPLMVRLNIKIQ
jgi:hypothetical protein